MEVEKVETEVFLQVDVSLFPTPALETVNFCSASNGQFVDGQPIRNSQVDTPSTPTEKLWNTADAANALRQVVVGVLYALAAGSILVSRSCTLLARTLNESPMILQLAICLTLRAWWEYKLLLGSVEVTRQTFFPEDDPDAAPPTISQLHAFYEASKSPAVYLALGSQTNNARRTWLFVLFYPARRVADRRRTRTSQHQLRDPPTSHYVLLHRGVGGIGCRRPAPLDVQWAANKDPGGGRGGAHSFVERAEASDHSVGPPLDLVDDFAIEITSAMNTHLSATSMTYASGVNNVVSPVLLRTPRAAAVKAHARPGHRGQ